MKIDKKYIKIFKISDFDVAIRRRLAFPLLNAPYNKGTP